MSLKPGDRLGPYEILAAIGKGGMGEVFRARDPRLGREVAIKVSAERFSERFEREARAIAALNHPNICHLYDVGPDYLVMELVEGESPKGPMAFDDALALMRQVADALEAAHDKGIVHRDLKPGNIKITPEGKVKVLDFGLAKVSAAASGSTGEDSPTISMAATQAGMILGTAAYMAPEQARGKNVDKRADIWAFGVVFHELLTGKRLFQGEDLTETLASVVKGDPDLGPVPARVRRLLRKCLEKDPRQRLRDIGDVWEMLGEPISQATTKAPVWPWAIAALAVIAAAVFGYLWSRPDPLPTVTRFQIVAPPGSTLPPGTPAPSPNGQLLAYVVRGPDGENRLHVRDLVNLTDHALPGTEEAVHPFWSPDGQSLAFAAAGTLKRIDLNGGLPRVVGTLNGAWHGDWSEGGDILLTSPGGLDLIPAGGGARRSVLAEHNHPAFLPRDERFLVRGSKGGNIHLHDPRTKQTTKVLEVNSAPLVAWAPNGKTYLFYLLSPDLMVQEFDTPTGAVLGMPRGLVNGIGVVANPPVKPTVGVSRAGVLAYQSGQGNGLKLSWVDRTGRVLGSFAADTQTAIGVRISPDGRWLSYVREDDLWLTDLERPGSPTRLTFQGVQGTPQWLSDSSGLLFRREERFYLARVDGSPEREVLGEGLKLTGPIKGAAPAIVAQKGKMILRPLDKEGDTPVVGSPGGRTQSPALSPNGQYIAYESDESGRSEIYVQRAPPSTERIRVSSSGGNNPQWRADGKELYFLPRGQVGMAAVATDFRDGLRAGEERVLFRIPAIVGALAHPSGERFLIREPVGGNQDSPITVVLNWWVELERAAPEP